MSSFFPFKKLWRHYLSKLNLDSCNNRAFIEILIFFSPSAFFFSWLIPFYSHVTLAWSVKFPQKRLLVCAYFFSHLSYNLEGAFTVEECLFPLLPQVACSQVSQPFGTKLAHSLLNQPFSSFI